MQNKSQEMMKVQKDIFISYSRCNLERAQEIISYIEQCTAAKCWIDLEGISGGLEFRNDIINAIKESRFVVFLISKESMESEWTRKEVYYAISEKTVVIPVRIDDSELQEWCRFEFSGVDIIDYANELHRKKLIRTICEKVGHKPKEGTRIRDYVGNPSKKKSKEKKESVPVIEKSMGEWFLNAEQGDPVAQNYIGNCYYDGKGVVCDYAEAVKWYRAAAEQGYAEAQCRLGACYRNGEGVRQSDMEAVSWWCAAAEQGYAEAQYCLGMCYNKGLGIHQSYSEAAKLFRAAAEQGHAQAQYYLGACYEEGEITDMSEAEATAWYSRAAEQGHSGAQEALERINSLGARLKSKFIKIWEGE